MGVYVSDPLTENITSLFPSTSKFEWKKIDGDLYSLAGEMGKSEQMYGLDQFKVDKH